MSEAGAQVQRHTRHVLGAGKRPIDRAVGLDAGASVKVAIGAFDAVQGFAFSRKTHHVIISRRGILTDT